MSHSEKPYRYPLRLLPSLPSGALVAAVGLLGYSLCEAGLSLGGAVSGPALETPSLLAQSLIGLFAVVRRPGRLFLHQKASEWTRVVGPEGR